MRYVSVRGGQRVPALGLGTWQASSSQDVEQAVARALHLGYRHIDTAFNYNNEEAIGNALQAWFQSGQGSRDQLFVTTKLPHVGNRASDVERFLRLSLDKLKLDYVDLYLIHMPFSFVCDEDTLTPAVDENGEYRIDTTTDHAATWKAMEAQVDAGLARHIGLSNFNAAQIRNVFDGARIKPAVLQVELHLYMQQKELRALCAELEIAVTAYSPLGSPGAKFHFQKKYNYLPEVFPDILGHPEVTALAAKYAKTPAQVLLNFLTSLDIIVIPKSGNPQRLAENIEIFDFEMSSEDVARLEALDQDHNGRIFNFLFFKGIENHPEYPFKDELKKCPGQ